MCNRHVYTAAQPTPVCLGRLVVGVGPPACSSCWSLGCSVSARRRTATTPYCRQCVPAQALAACGVQRRGPRDAPVSGQGCMQGAAREGEGPGEEGQGGAGWWWTRRGVGPRRAQGDVGDRDKRSLLFAWVAARPIAPSLAALPHWNCFCGYSL